MLYILFSYIAQFSFNMIKLAKHLRIGPILIRHISKILMLYVGTHCTTQQIPPYTAAISDTFLYEDSSHLSRLLLISAGQVTIQHGHTSIQLFSIDSWRGDERQFVPSPLIISKISTQSSNSQLSRIYLQEDRMAWISNKIQVIFTYGKQNIRFRKSFFFRERQKILEPRLEKII